MEKNFLRLTELLTERKFADLKELLSKCNEVDIAAFIEKIPPEASTQIFRLLHKELAAEVFANLPSETKELIISAINDNELHNIIESLYVDDAVDTIEELPANMVKRVLKSAKPETRCLINQYLQYPVNSVGSIMTAEFTDLKQNMSVIQAIEHIRRTGATSEQIYTCYVINELRVLEGVISLRELMLSDNNVSISEIMETNSITAVTTEDREIVSRRMVKYGLLSIPVVDLENRLVGIVTADDVMDVLQEETTEDFEKMAAMSPSERPYLKTGVFELSKNRIVWLLVLMVSAMLTGGILGKFEAAFSSMPILVTFIPMLTDTGGNSGCQSSTMIIRGLAVGEIRPRNFISVLWKELRVSLLVGTALSIVNFIRLEIMYPESLGLSITVSLALLITVIVAKTIGGVLPLAAKVIKVDPAIMASPLITTIVDAVSLVVYFSIAKVILNL